MNKVQTKERMKRLHGKDWKTIQQKVMERDQYTCQDCGIEYSSIKMSLIIHHVVSYDICLSDDMDNLITLCQSCHYERHRQEEPRLQKAKTDNSFFEEKIRLRIDNLPDINQIKVLDMYMGQGTIWDEIKKRTKKDIQVLGVDTKSIKNKVYLKGDNRKFEIDYDAYDIIDLDAYGIPFACTRKIAKVIKKKAYIFSTVIQSFVGVLNTQMLIEIGYNKTMIQKCPTLFYRNGFDKYCAWLASIGVTEVKGYHTNNKHYIFYELCPKS